MQQRAVLARQGGLRRVPRAASISQVALIHRVATLRGRKAGTIVAASNEQDPPAPKSELPVLPPRKPKGQDKSVTGKPDRSNSGSSKTTARSKKSSSNPQPPQFPPGPGLPQDVMQERALAGLLAYTGMMGTVATAISLFAPDLDLFGNFHFSPDDIFLALKLMVPVYVMNVIIMLPNYSSWQLPEPSAESKQQMAEALAKWSSSRAGRAAAAGKGGDSSADSTTAGTSSSKQAGDSRSGGPTQHEAASTSESSSQAAASSNSSSSASGEIRGDASDNKLAAASKAATGDSSSSSTAANSPVVMDMQTSSSGSSSSSSSATGQWLQEQVAKSAVLSRAKDSLFLAQGHYLSQNPALVLPPAVQFVVLLAECLAAELLYRSVALQLAGGWISDRLYEAGADDFLGAVTSSLPVQPNTHFAGQLIAVALLSGAWGVTVLQRVFARRRPMMVALQERGSKEAADQLLKELRKNSDKRQSKQEVDSSSDAADSSKMASSSKQEAAAGVSGSGQQQQDTGTSQQDLQQQLPTQLASSETQQQQESGKPAQQQTQQQVEEQLDLQEQQWARRTLPYTMSALSLSQLIQGARDISQITALGLGFVLTGNLAAPFTAAVVNQALFSVLQKNAMERARKRSQAIASQLAGLARQLRDIQRKQLESNRQQQLEVQQEQQQQSVTAATAVQETTASAAASPGSSTAADGTAAAGDQQQSAAGVLHVSSGEAEGAAGSVLGSRMDKTISVLDMLLDEQMGGHAAAGPGSGGK